MLQFSEQLISAWTPVLSAYQTTLKLITKQSKTPAIHDVYISFFSLGLHIKIYFDTDFDKKS
jgi:hypothetical protein